MNKPDEMLRDLIKLQRDFFALVEKHPELNEKPLAPHTQTALKSVMALYDNSLVESIRSSLPAADVKRIMERKNLPHLSSVSPA